jgi:hypothetical protein
MNTSYQYRNTLIMNIIMKKNKKKIDVQLHKKKTIDRMENP